MIVMMGEVDTKVIKKVDGRVAKELLDGYHAPLDKPARLKNDLKYWDGNAVTPPCVSRPAKKVSGRDM